MKQFERKIIPVMDLVLFSSLAMADDPACPVRPMPAKTCSNPFRHLVECAKEIGVNFYVCQIASRMLGIKTTFKIEGVKYVPAGHIAVADFQVDGYTLIDL